MRKLTTTRAYNKKLRQVMKDNGETVPTMVFVKDNETLHALFLPSTGKMIYQVSDAKKEIECYEVQEAYLHTNPYNQNMRAIIGSPFPNLWISIEFDSWGGQIAQFVPREWVEDFKKRNSYTRLVEHIGLRLHQLANKIAQ
jgi:hypothetical protein